MSWKIVLLPNYLPKAMVELFFHEIKIFISLSRFRNAKNRITTCIRSGLRSLVGDRLLLMLPLIYWQSQQPLSTLTL